MSNKESKAIICPSCGAPLEAKEEAKRVKCGYCGTLVNIAQSAQSATPVTPPAQTESKTIVDPEDAELDAAEQDIKRSWQIIIAIVAAIFFVVLGVIRSSKPAYRPVPTLRPNNTPAATSTPRPPSLAKHLLTFNLKDSAPENPKDASALVVNSQGNIMVSDIDAGHIRIFDETGKLITTITTNKNAPVTGMAVSTSGEILLVHNLEIHRYNTEGQETGVMKDQLFEEVFTASDGSLYTLSVDQTISHYKQNGELDFQIKDAFGQYASTTDSPTLTVDEDGQMYLLGINSGWVLKFSADGTFLNKFNAADSLKVTSSAPAGDSAFFGLVTPTKTPTPKNILLQSIAVDANSRVYVCTSEGISIFSTSNQYVGSFRPASGNCEKMAFDNASHLYILTTENRVGKFEILTSTQ